MKLIDNRKNDASIKVKYGDNLISYSDNKIKDIEYSELCKHIYSIEKSGYYKLIFNFGDMANDLKLNSAPHKYWNNPQDLIPFGYKSVGGVDNLLFIYKGKIYITDYEQDELLKDSLSQFLYENVYDTEYKDLPEIGQKMGYTKVKIAGSHYPLILILGMIYGLKNVMNRYKIAYTTSKERDAKKGYVELRFKDSYLYYKETIENQILMNGLYFAGTHDYNIDEFNGSTPYDE
jgi:hypothetical protein